MEFLSVCSGIEAVSVAVKDIPGWKCIGVSEIEPFPCAVLKYRFPNVPNFGDMTKLNEKEEYRKLRPALVVGGTPCQGFSIAGLRGGLDDERSKLSLEFIRILQDKRPEFLLWENVPGVLSSNGGSDFANILSGFTGLDIAPRKWERAGVIEGAFYSVAWRILDSQYFGEPQRRRRIFLVGNFGKNWRAPYAVLFESESLRGNIKKGSKKGQEVTGTISTGFGSRGVDGDQVIDGAFQIMHHQSPHENIAATAQSGGNVGVPSSRGEHLVIDEKPLIMAHGMKNAEIVEDGCPTLTCKHEQPILRGWPAELANTLNASFGEKQGLENEHINANAPLFVPFEKTSTDVVRQSTTSVDVDICPTLKTDLAHQSGPIIFQGKASEQQSMNPSDISPTLDKSKSDGIVVFDNQQITSPTNRSNPNEGDPAHTISKGNAHNACIVSTQATMIGRGDENGPQGSGLNEDTMFTLTKGDVHAVADLRVATPADHANYKVDDVINTLRARNGEELKTNSSPETVIQLGHTKSNGSGIKTEDVASNVKATSSVNQAVQNTTQIRRITPTECARLQGFPDSWAKIPWKGKPAEQCPDGPQYKAYGNSMNTSVVRWICERIDKVDKILKSLKP